MIRTLPVAASIRRAFCISVMLAAAGPAFAASTPTTAAEHAAGILRAPSSHSVEDTVARIKTAVEAKGIKYFVAIDQQQLGAAANLPIRKSTLVLFGNPPLGVQFLSANPYAGLDWPVRILVAQDADGTVYVAYSDFDWIAARYDITNRAAQIKMASEVAGSIAGSVAGK